MSDKSYARSYESILIKDNILKVAVLRDVNVLHDYAVLDCCIFCDRNTSEDNGTFNNGVDFDLLFRNLDDFTADVASVVECHQARNGYTTCMWHNLLTCKILYDENGRLKAAKDRFSVPYPQELKQNIISRNRLY